MSGPDDIDVEIRERITSALRELNAALRTAARAGLRLEIDKLSFEEFGVRRGRHEITVSVWREIE